MIKERDIEKYLDKRIREEGGERRRVSWQGRRGAPDDIIFLRGAYFVECKKPGGKLEPHQVRERARMRKRGVGVWVLDSFDKIDDFISWISGRP